MIISRIIDGKNVDIVLTAQELRDARWVAEEEYDKEYVLDLADIYEEEEVKSILKNDAQVRARVAHVFRKYMDEQIDGEAEYNCFRWAVDDCVELGKE